MRKTFLPFLLLLITIFLPLVPPANHVVAQVSAPAAKRAFITITDDYGPLRAQFNEDHGKTRLLILLSPS